MIFPRISKTSFVYILLFQIHTLIDPLALGPLKKLLIVDLSLWCDDSNKTYSAVLKTNTSTTHGTIFLACTSNFKVSRWKSLALQFK